MSFLIRGALPLGLPYTRSRAPLRRRAPIAWLARDARSRLRTSTRFYAIPSSGDTKLKHDADTEPELALIDPFAPETIHAGDRHEVFAVADVVVRIGQMRRVGEIVRLQAQLHSEAVCRRDLARQAEIPVEEARSAQNVVARVAESRLGHL